MLIYYSFFFFFQPLPQPVLQPPPRPQPAPARSSKDARGGMSTRDARLTARNAPDNHQVFIGNLPAGVKDEEVRNVFSSECTCGQIISQDICSLFAHYLYSTLCRKKDVRQTKMSIA